MLGNGLTTNYLTKYGTSNDLLNSQIFDNGTSVGIGTTNPNATLTVVGDISATGTIISNNNVWSYAGNGTQTVFAITGGISIVSAAYLVTIDGIVQKTTNYTINNVIPRTFTMSTAIPNGSELEIRTL